MHFRPKYQVLHRGVLKQLCQIKDNRVLLLLGNNLNVKFQQKDGQKSTMNILFIFCEGSAWYNRDTKTINVGRTVVEVLELEAVTIKEETRASSTRPTMPELCDRQQLTCDQRTSANALREGRRRQRTRLSGLNAARVRHLVHCLISRRANTRDAPTAL